MRSIYSKLALTSIGIILVSALLGFYIANAYYHESIKPLNDEKNVRIAQAMTAFLEEHGEVQLDSYLANVAAVGYQICLVDGNGAERYFGAAFKDKRLDEPIKRRVLAGEVYHGMREFPKKTFMTGFFANELRNTIGAPFTYNGTPHAIFIRPDIKLLFSEIHTLLGWMIAIMLVVSIALVIVSSKFLVSPIVKLTEATREVKNGRFAVKLDITRNDEIGVLARSFEEMSMRLSQLDAMRTEFVSNVSHDFQSPLLNIQGYTQLLAQEGLSAEERAQYIAVIREETDRLSLLTKQLLLLTSLDKEESYCRPERFELGRQMTELVRKSLWLLEEKGLALTYTIPDVSFYGDPALLYNVWENLLTNAIKYNKENGTITIVLTDEPARVVVEFRDTGIGMTDQEAKRVFDRFYRADASRSRAIPGTGLGLSIVSRIVELHRGTIAVSSRPGEGTSFVVTLPKKD
ncbi:two-component sensor histidine kinase [Paenibacillus sp. J31TS4]|uniref:sensor histidine kinase n=1 Tax=Paenibacillus sp. J31TS4 TaxID=2807195 RepID=UPI001B2F0CFC|nr:HAMP domain-containing sensor histidine kinase [Paenibacillus sp. J31TS4]GIP41419.1 two-component sensor histidine kinase [Paenibacillus sp. J31TS4]